MVGWLLIILLIQNTSTALSDQVGHTKLGELVIPAPTDALHKVMRVYGQHEHLVLPTLNRLELVNQTDRWLDFIFSPYRVLIVTYEDGMNGTSYDSKNLILDSVVWDQVIFINCSLHIIDKTGMYSNIVTRTN